MEKQQLYFIESIVKLGTHEDFNNENGNERSHYRYLVGRRIEEESTYAIVMEQISKCESNVNESKEIDESAYSVITLPESQLRLNTGTRLQEGMFVLYSPESKLFVQGRWTPEAIALYRENRKYRRAILERSWHYTGVRHGGNARFMDDNFFSAKSNEISVFSYHVNVGHGNCSFILFIKEDDYRLWMVDCGIFDYTNKKNYQSNIELALECIASKVNKEVEDIHINRFMLTHWHFDHFSGINFLINNHYITHDTIFVMNLYYGHASKSANLILSQLDDLRVICYEPTTYFSTQNLSVLYPNTRVRRWAYSADGSIAISNVNDSSAVYVIECNNLSMIFPGDLEQAGFSRMIRNGNLCFYKLHRAQYYCVSHHASSTGHIVAPCRILPTPTRCIKNCWFPNLQHAIIMGRDNAFRGIYSQQVLQDWSPESLFSEYSPSGKQARLLMIDWKNNAFQHI